MTKPKTRSRTITTRRRPLTIEQEWKLCDRLVAAALTDNHYEECRPDHDELSLTRAREPIT